MKTHSWIMTAVAGLLVIGTAHPAPQAAGGLTRNGRWFRDNGNPVYMIGVDMQSLMAQKPRTQDPNWDGNYTPILNELQSAGINKVRLWANNWFIAGDKVYQPFRRLASGRYDLDQWDSTYWSRLRDFAQKCRSRGIFIEYCLFSQYPTKPAERWGSTSSFWNRDRNVNGAFSDTDGGDGFYAEMFNNAPGQRTTSGHDLTYYQRRLIDKVVTEVGGVGNLYFQVFNEPRDGGSGQSWGSDIWPWTRSIARYIHDTKGYLSSVEVRAGDPANLSLLSQYAGRSYVDIMGNHTYNGEPALIGRELSPFQRTGQILQCSESFSFRTHLDTVTREAWAWAVSGGHYAFYIPDKEFSMIGDAQWDVVARRARTLRQVMESVSFWRMSPVDAAGNEYDSLISAGPSGGNRQLLADPGSEYIGYFWGTKSTTAARISLPAGTYAYDWIDVRNGTVLRTGAVTGGGNTSVPAPATSGWNANAGLALVLKATSATVSQVTVTAPDPTASEPGTNTGSFRISRTGDTTNALGVTIRLSGTASEGSDYASIGTSITISPGSGSRTVTVRPSDDATVEGNETVVLDLQPGTGYQVGSSSRATVTITDNDSPPTNQPPTVTLTAPGNGATFTSPATVTLQATASDPDGSVSNVEFFRGGTRLSQDGTAPYTYTWNNVANGTYTLTARATDNSGASTTSSPVTIVVTSPSPGPQRVTGLVLIDADLDQPIAGFDPILDGATLDLATLPTRNLSIRADTNPGTVGSVVFDYDAVTAYQVENVLPYSFTGDNAGDFNPWTPALGAHTLTATPYTGSGGTGTAGVPETIAFTVVDSAGGAGSGGGTGTAAVSLGSEGRNSFGDRCPLAAVSMTPFTGMLAWPAILALLLLLRRRGE